MRRSDKMRIEEDIIEQKTIDMVQTQTYGEMKDPSGVPWSEEKVTDLGNYVEKKQMKQ